MPLGINSVILTGDVGDVTFSKTLIKNDAAVTFRLCVENRENFPVWVKCNAYGDIAKYIQMKDLKTGARVEVIGELMNRRTKGEDRLDTEIKVTKQINIFNRKGVHHQ